jgi:hypothetical protein
LRVGVDKNGRTVTGGFGGDGEMRYKRGLTGPTLLAC